MSGLQFLSLSILKSINLEVPSTMILFPYLGPARVIGSALLLGGIAGPHAYAQQTNPHLGSQVASMSLVPALLGIDNDPRFTPQSAPQSPDTSTVEGPTPKTPAAPAADRVILPNLGGLVFIDNVKALQPGGVTGEGVVTKNLPMLDDPAIHDQLAAFLGKPLTQGGIRDLGALIANWYREKKYPFVDVSVPAGQDVTNGVVQVVVAESRLGKVVARGNYWFTSEFLESQVRLNPGDRINIGDLEEDKNWINQNPFRLVNIVASRGVQPGVTDLTVDTIQEKFPARFYAGYSNSGTPVIGHDRWDLGFIWGNAFWHDDQLSYQFQSSDDFWHNREQFAGKEDHPSFIGHSINYAMALPWRDKIIVYGYYLQASPLLGPNVGIVGTDGSAGIRYSMRLPSTRKFDEHLEFGYEFKTSNNNLEFGGFAVSNITTEVDQFVIQYDATLRDDYGQTQLINVLTYSPGGITDLNKTIFFQQQTGSADAHSDYLYDHLVITRVTGLPLGSDLAKSLGWFGGVTSITKLVAQVADGNLVPSEELGAGGAASVRGYDERAANGSQGVLISEELRSPAFSLAKLFLDTNSPWNDQSQIGVFYDYGSVSNNVQIPSTPSSAQLESVGLGYHMIAGPDQNVRLDLDYGFQLRKLPGFADTSQFGHVAVTLAY
ncbi:MAG: peptide transporter [Rhodospirillales bacterium]|nr:peptide transporter [Rhodospirillales bacterium]